MVTILACKSPRELNKMMQMHKRKQWTWLEKSLSIPLTMDRVVLLELASLDSEQWLLHKVLRRTVILTTLIFQEERGKKRIKLVVNKLRRINKRNLDKKQQKIS